MHGLFFFCIIEDLMALAGDEKPGDIRKTGSLKKIYRLQKGFVVNSAGVICAGDQPYRDIASSSLKGGSAVYSTHKLHKGIVAVKSEEVSALGVGVITADVLFVN